MADFLADFRAVSAPLDSTIDPFDFLAVFAPRIDIEDDSPPVATAITVLSVPVERTDPLVIQIDDTILIRQLLAGVKYDTGAWELAYDGADFSPLYKTAASGPSTLVKPSNTQWVLTLRRAGGWPYSPIACVRPIDGAGNMA